jgi:drug/metabolite transporter (DMT)-like permease
MTWVLFALGAALSWGLYGVTLHKGQVTLGNPLKALLCVGAAYFLVGVLFPVGGLMGQEGGFQFKTEGLISATIAGALGAIGAVCIIWAFKNGGLPNYVMPLVFGGAPLVNVGISMIVHPPKVTPNPLLWIGYVLASTGVYLVLRFRPPA